MKWYRVFRYVMMNMVKKPLYVKANSKLEKPTLYVKYKGKMITYKRFMKRTQANHITIGGKGKRMISIQHMRYFMCIEHQR
jgi:hypothetical protein